MLEEAIQSYQAKRLERLEAERARIRALVPQWAHELLRVEYVEAGSEYISKTIRYRYGHETQEYVNIIVKVVGVWALSKARYYFNMYSNGELESFDLQRVIAHAVTYEQERKAERARYV